MAAYYVDSTTTYEVHIKVDADMQNVTPRETLRVAVAVPLERLRDVTKRVSREFPKRTVLALRVDTVETARLVFNYKGGEQEGRGE